MTATTATTVTAATTAPKTTRIKLMLAYDGTDFCGWQHQGGVRTVQCDVEAALAKIIGEPTHVQAAGRTDSGVHALAQCAHFDAPQRLSHVPWDKALNGLLAPDVRVLSAQAAAPGFHAQFDARSKIYAYTIWLERGPVNPLRRRFVWSPRPPRLDLAAMDEAAAVLIGTHDFNSFRNLGTPLGDRGTVRTLAGIWREPGGPSEMVWRFQANGFLKQMVRNIMGCLVAVGRGKVTPADVRLILEKRDRSIAPPTAPAMGLCMERVFYPEDLPGAPEDLPASPEGLSGGPENARPVVAASKDAAHDEHQMAGGGQSPRPGPHERD